MVNQENYSEIASNNIIIYKENQAYPELQHFLQQIESSENSIIHQPYFINKKRVFTYKAVFFLFGSLFFLLACVIYFKNPNWFSHFILWDGYLVKHFVSGFALCLASISYLITYTIRTEIEVAKYIASRGKFLLAGKYKRKRAKFNIIDCLPFSRHYQKKDLLRQTYLDALDKIYHVKEEYVSLLARITHSQSLSRDIKEKLYNQTLLKFKDDIENIVAVMNED